jgi:type IV pilus assembly protein PilC
MHANIIPFNPLDNFSSSLEKGNNFSTKYGQIFSILAWGMRCNIPLDEALLTLRTGKYKDTLLNKKVIWEQKFLWNRDITRTAEDLKNGLPLCEAITHLKQYFPPYVEPAIREAEKYHALDKVLPLMARQMRYSVDVYKQRTTCFTYPIIHFIQCFGITSGLIIFIIPKFKRIYAEFSDIGSFPVITQAILDFSEYFPVILRFVLWIIPCFILFRFFYKRVPGGRFITDLFLFHLPFIGKDMRKMAFLEFAGSMACYTEAGFDIIDAAELSNETVRSFWLRRRISVFIKKTRNGTNWINAWEEMNLGFPFYDWIARNAAAQEKVTDGFMQMMKWLKNDISKFSIIFVKCVEIIGLLLNALFVGFIVLGLGYGLFNLIYVVAANT